MSSLSVWPVGHSGHGSAEPYPAGSQRPPTSVCVSEVCRRSPPPAGPYTLALLVPSQNSYQGPLGQSRTPVTEQNSPFEWSVGLTLSRSLLGRQESHHNLCSFRKKKPLCPCILLPTLHTDSILALPPCQEELQRLL